MIGTLEERQDKLLSHIEMRKYKEKAESWVGVIINQKTRFFDSLVSVSYPWEKDEDFEKALNKLPKAPMLNPQELKKKLEIKVGRNHRCPCGSGAKFKACCMEQPDSFCFYQLNFLILFMTDLALNMTIVTFSSQ